MITYASQKRRDELVSRAERFLLLASSTDRVATQLMQAIVKEILKAALEDRTYKMIGGWKVTAIRGVFDSIDAAIKFKQKRPDLINTPNLKNIHTRIRKLEWQFFLAESKVSHLYAPQLFNVLKVLKKSGLEATLDFIIITASKRV